MTNRDPSLPWQLQGPMDGGGRLRARRRAAIRRDVDAFFLEYDSERAGGFEPLRFMPKDKTVVLGLVTSKRRSLEPLTI